MLVRKVKGRDRIRDLDVNGRILLKEILKKYRVCVDWIHLTLNRVQGQVV
jgi:hypothetical protein